MKTIVTLAASLLAISMTTSAAEFRARGSGALLVRVEGKLADQKRLDEAATFGRYRLERLFRSPPAKTAENNDEAWFLARPTDGRGGSASGWEEAYSFVREARERKAHPAFATVSATYAEPDQEQQWFDTSAPSAKGWPKGPRFAWHLMDQYTQLEIARKAAGGGGCRMRLTILDTGINPVHITVPRQIQKQLGWNYVENNNNVADPGISGGLNNPGHGTATIALLAGNHVKVKDFDDDFGGAPAFDVVPVRIANSVVHFWTRTMAQGIDHAANLKDEPGKDYCDVLSISMGGLASRAWARAVNNAYEKGVMIVAASGNNFSDLPTRYTVYPSRFGRVTTVVGVTAAYTPYRVDLNKGASGMQGNYGPESVMRKAIAAYTPEITWARLKEANGQASKDGFDSDGGGTSCATPQVAAAGALWLATHGSKFPRGWERVEAARWALFESAKMPGAGFKDYLGRGLLQAKDALAKVPSDPKQAGPAEVSFPFLRLLLGWDEPGEGIDRMYEVEAFNLAMSAKELSPLTGRPPAESSKLSYAEKVSIVNEFLRQPDISPTLKEKLQKTSIPK